MRFLKWNFWRSVSVFVDICVLTTQLIKRGLRFVLCTCMFSRSIGSFSQIAWLVHRFKSARREKEVSLQFYRFIEHLRDVGPLCGSESLIAIVIKKKTTHFLAGDAFSKNFKFILGAVYMNPSWLQTRHRSPARVSPSPAKRLWLFTWKTRSKPTLNKSPRIAANPGQVNRLQIAGNPDSCMWK